MSCMRRLIRCGGLDGGRGLSLSTGSTSASVRSTFATSARSTAIREKTFTPWRGRLAGISESRASGCVIPYLIEYDLSVEVNEIFRTKHEVARHDVQVGTVALIRTDGEKITQVAIEASSSFRFLSPADCLPGVGVRPDQPVA